jgi:hypothetical protein
MGRHRSTHGPPVAWSARGTACTRSLPLAAVWLTALALAGCSSFGFGQSDPKPVDPNVFPADYKPGLIAFLQNNPFGLVGTREASLSAPELKPFGQENRYVACLRVAGPDWRKDKMVVYFGGAINQFVDAGDQCNSAAFQPFPELPALFATLRSKK